jgi:hypothetical protein
VARPPALSLSDFEADDHAVLQQAAPTAPAPLNLIALAGQNKLRVTSGYSKGGHNSGSMHYQGSPEDPGAIDIDPRGVTPEKVAQWKAQGYTVLDERSRPAGQAVWTGPHYHIQKSRSGQVPQRSPQKREITGTTSATGPVKLGPVDLSMPVSTDANGNIVFNQGSTQPKTVDLSKALKPVQKRQVADTGLDLSDFELSPDELAEVQSVAARYKPQPKPAPATAPPKNPGIIEGVGNILNAGGQMLQQIPGAFQKEMQSAQANPVFNQQEMMAAALAGAASTPTDLLNLATQAPAAIGNAYLGRQQFKPLFPEVYGVRDIPGLKEITERHPVSDFIGGAAVPLDMGIGALKAGRAGKLAEIGERSGFVNHAGQEIIPGHTGPVHGFVNRNGIEINPRLTPQEAARVDVTPKPGQPTNIKELSTAFEERQRPANPAQVIDPRKAEIPAELGPVKTETTPGGVELVTKAGQKETPHIEIERGLPEGRPQENTPQVVPLREELRALRKNTDAATLTSKIRELEQGNLKAMESAQTGVPITLSGFRANTGPMVPGRGKFYGIDLGIVKGYGKTFEKHSAGKHLEVDRIEFKNPVVALSQEELLRKIGKEGDFNKLKGSSYNRNNYALKDKYIADWAAKNGHDGVLYKNGEFAIIPAKEKSLLPDAPPTAQELPTPTGLRSSLDVATERANALEKMPDADIHQPRVSNPGKSTELPTPAKPDMAPAILDASGKPVRGATREIGNVLEFPGKPKPADAPLELPRSFEPKTRELPTAASTESGFSPFPDSGAAPETVNPAKPRDAELEAAARKQGQKLVSVAEISQMMERRFPEHSQHFKNILEAAKNNHTVMGDHVPIEEGGRTTNKREFNPIDFAVKTISPKREVEILRKQHGQDFGAIRDALVQRLNKEGIRVNAADQQIDGLGPKQAVARLNKLAAKLPDEARTYPYVVDHNLGETVRGGSHGFRRLDRFTDTSLTGKTQALPAGAEANMIAPAMKALNDLAESHSSPVFKRAIKQIQSGGISKQTVRELKAALGDEKLAAQFCSVLGIKT